tara:strand:- start:543 stop:740 length:198 start_codon:yes stop_codon:yes gene_type:complete
MNEKEYPVDEDGVCLLCEGTFIVARMEAYEESEGATVEFPVFCVCAEEDWAATPVNEILEIRDDE